MSHIKISCYLAIAALGIGILAGQVAQAQTEVSARETSSEIISSPRSIRFSIMPVDWFNTRSEVTVWVDGKSQRKIGVNGAMGKGWDRMIFELNEFISPLKAPRVAIDKANFDRLGNYEGSELLAQVTKVIHRVTSLDAPGDGRASSEWNKQASGAAGEVAEGRTKEMKDGTVRAGSIGGR